MTSRNPLQDPARMHLVWYTDKLYMSDLELYLQAYVERVDLIPDHVGRKVLFALGFDIAVPVPDADTRVVAVDDVVDTGFPFRAQVAIQRVDAGISAVGLEPPDADFIWNQKRS
jgi:hypothetical protein